ncbi:MAG: hypothetical protein U0892_08175 [Pirellulales bacterium]
MEDRLLDETMETELLHQAERAEFSPFQKLAFLLRDVVGLSVRESAQALAADRVDGEGSPAASSTGISHATPANVWRSFTNHDSSPQAPLMFL